MTKKKIKKIWMPQRLQNLLFTYSDDIIFKVAWGGRYGAKTWSFEFAAVKYVLENPGSNFLCIRGTQTSIENSLLSGIKKAIQRMGVEQYFDIGERYIKTKPIDGKVSKFIFMGALSYENFRSIEDVNVAWVDEGHVIKEAAWDVIIPSIRGKRSEIWVTFNAKRKDDWVYRHFILEGDPLAKVVKINYDENLMLPERERKKAEAMKNSNYRKYRHIYLGELDDQPEGALWTDDMIQYNKKIDYKDLEAIVVAIDPAGDNPSESSDECGIVVTGKLGERGFVLKDSSAKLTQLQQAKRAIKDFYIYEADYIVVEKNGVGEGMKTIISQIDSSVPVRTVSAKRGKYLRAEPVSALYESGKIYHTQTFVDLEYEMTSYTGSDKEASPNRLDALVYGLTQLFKKSKSSEPPPGWGVADRIF